MESTLSVAARGQKGKIASRSSWADLPQELLRTIADAIVLPAWYHHLAYSPWKDAHIQSQQKLWAGLMAAQSLQSMRLVCPKWEVALEVHWIWNHVATMLDPQGIDSQYLPVVRQVPSNKETGSAHSTAALVPRLPRVPRQRTCTNYMKTLAHSCLPCRFAAPELTLSVGVNAGVDTIWSRYFGKITLCDRHRADTVCGVCLKDTYVDSWRLQNGHLILDSREKSIFITEDEDVFRHISATCRTCRSTSMWQALGRQFPRKYHAVIEPIVDGFVECAEGSVREILAEAEEKVWMITQTNFNELRDSALAVERMRLKQELRAEREAEEMAAGRRTTSEARLQELLDQNADPAMIEEAIALQVAEEEDDDEFIDEDLGELLNASEEQNVADMALSGWARNRILDGCWISPLDIYHGAPGPKMRPEALQRLVPAWHPVNSYLNPNPSDPAEAPLSPEDQPQPTKPRPQTVRCSLPAARIFSRTQWMFDSTFRQVVYPALQNLVKRIVNEAEMEGRDVCQLALMFNGRRLVEELLSIQLWGRDYDWTNIQTSPTITSTATIDSASDRDSPPSTLRTTPSPSPPSSTSPKSNGEVFAPAQRTTVFPLSPTPSRHPLPTQFLDHIPHVPRSIEHIGHQTLVILEGLWKEATSGLFKCQCGICYRASGIAEARERARRNAKEEEEAKMNATEEATPPTRQQKAPSPSPNLKTVQLEDEEGEVPDRLESLSPPPLVRSRSATPESENHIPMQGVETPRSLQGAGRRRSREEVEADDPDCSSDDDSGRGAKKLRIATAKA